MSKENFENYKEKQEYYKKINNARGRMVYETGKQTDKNGKVIVKGKPYVKPKVGK